jgi:plasmid stabilization system protein ParE
MPMSKVYKAIFSRYAEDDLNEIIEYYFAINPDYARKLLTTFEKRVGELRKYPERARIVPELEEQNILEYREMIEGNYRIIFAIQEETVVVHTIIDSRRNVEEVIINKLMRYYK